MMNKRIIGIFSIILIFSCIYSVYCEADETAILQELEEKKELEKNEGKNKNKKKNVEKSEEEDEMKEFDKDNLLLHVVNLFNSESAMQKVAEYIEENPEFAKDLQELSEKVMSSLSFIAAEDLQNAVIDGNKDVISEVQSVLESMFNDNKMKSVLEKFVEICLSAYDGENLNPETIEEIKKIFTSSNNHHHHHHHENNNKKRKHNDMNLFKKSKKARKEINEEDNGIVESTDAE